MPEPGGVATLVGETLPRIYRFSMHDDRIDCESDRYAVIEKGLTILIDPLPMSAQDLKQLGPVKAICLTVSCHERAAWRYRRSLKAPINAPQGGVDFEEPPDHWYKAGDQLPVASLQSTRLGRPRPIMPSILNETGASCSAPIFSRMWIARGWLLCRVNIRTSRRAPARVSDACWSCSSRHSVPTTDIP